MIQFLSGSRSIFVLWTDKHVRDRVVELRSRSWSGRRTSFTFVIGSSNFVHVRDRVVELRSRSWSSRLFSSVSGNSWTLASFLVVRKLSIQCTRVVCCPQLAFLVSVGNLEEIFCLATKDVAMGTFYCSCTRWQQSNSQAAMFAREMIGFSRQYSKHIVSEQNYVSNILRLSRDVTAAKFKGLEQ